MTFGSNTGHTGTCNCPVFFLTGGKRIPVLRRLFYCGTTGIPIDFKFACDGVDHCADVSDEKACEYINTGTFPMTRVTVSNTVLMVLSRRVVNL